MPALRQAVSRRVAAAVPESLRPVHQDRARCADGVSVPAGALVLTPVTLPWLNCQFARSATWQKWSKDEGEWRPADPPAKYAETLMHLAGEWRAPVLTGGPRWSGWAWLIRV